MVYSMASVVILMYLSPLQNRNQSILKWHLAQRLYTADSPAETEIIAHHISDKNCNDIKKHEMMKPSYGTLLCKHDKNHISHLQMYDML